MGLTAADEIQYACRDEQAAAGDRYPVRQLMKKYDADQKGKQVLRVQVDRDLRRWGIAVRHRKEILRRCADDAGQDEHADLFPPQRCESLRDHDGQRGDDAEAHEAERDRKRGFILQLSDDRIGQSGKEPGAQSGQRFRLDEAAGRPQDEEDAGKGDEYGQHLSSRHMFLEPDHRGQQGEDGGRGAEQRDIGHGISLCRGQKQQHGGQITKQRAQADQLQIAADERLLFPLAQQADDDGRYQ